MSEIRIELKLSRSSGVLAGIVAKLAQAGLQLQSQRLDRSGTGWLSVLAEGECNDPAALVDLMEATRGVDRLMALVVDDRALIADGEPVAQPLEDQVDEEDLALLAVPGQAAADDETNSVPTADAGIGEPVAGPDHVEAIDADQLTPEPTPEPQPEAEPEHEAEVEPERDPYLDEYATPPAPEAPAPQVRARTDDPTPEATEAADPAPAPATESLDDALALALEDDATGTPENTASDSDEEADHRPESPPPAAPDEGSHRHPAGDPGERLLRRRRRRRR